MINLESCVSQHIKNLVSSLTNKKQFKAVSSELSKLVSTFGIAAEKYMFSVLLQDIEFKDPRTISSSKDQFKVMFLVSAMQTYSLKPAFLDYFSQIFPSGDIEEFFDIFTKILSLPAVTQLIIAVSLSLSSTPHVARAGVGILKSKLNNYLQTQKPQKIPSYAFHCILYLLKSSSEFSENTYKEWSSQLSTSLQVEEKSKILPLLNEGKENFNLVETKNFVLSEIKSSLTLAEILEDMGPYCSQALTTLREIFSNFPEIREAEMAEVLAVMCEKCSDVLDYESRVISATFSSVKQEDWHALGRDISDKRVQASWNLDVFTKAVRETYTLHWDQVIENLDIPRFVIRNEQAFSLLVTLFFKITGKKFPILPLFKVWKNPRGQVSLLLQAIYSPLPYEMFNFADSPNKAPTEEIEMQPELKVIIQALSSLDLLKVLFELSATEFYVSIRNVFINEIKRFPDILIIGLAMVKPSRGQGLLTELINLILPQFMSPQTSSTIVLQIIWNHNPDLIVHGAVEYYEREHNSIALSHLLDLTQEIRDSLLKLVSCENHSFTVHFGLLAIKRDFLHLEHWIKERIQNGKEAFVRTLLEYFQKNIIDQIKDSDLRGLESLLDKAQVTKESLAVIFEKLNDQNLPADVADKVNQLYSDILKLIPSLYPATSQEEIDEAANRYYQQLYSNEISIPEFISLVKRLKSSAIKQENDIFDCMINNLFDEFRFFSKYPEKELKITGELFGSLVNQNLLVGVHLFLALKHTEIALRTPKTKLFRFGWFALTQFKDRLVEWPNFCNELLASEGLNEEKPEFLAWIRSICNVKKSEEVGEVPAEPAGFWDKGKEDEQKYSIVGDHGDKIMFIMNTIDQQNVLDKAEELRKLMLENESLNVPWFANYLVVKRVSLEINFHDLYLRMIKNIGMKSLYSSIISETYDAIHRLLSPARGLEETDRKVLNSLGLWLGTLTLARNKPILLRFIDLKEEIIKSYEKENIGTVIPFICNILKSSSTSEVFSNSNPWIVSLASLLLELKQKEGVKLRISHEIENLFKSIKMTPESIPSTSVLTMKEIRTYETAKEFVPASEVVVALTPEHRSMDSLPEYVHIAPKLAEIYPEQELRKIISISIEQVIKEIIQPIVQRNVNIALITTKELVLKDFSMEKDPNKLQDASRWVVQSLAGSLARVTSREPFRVHLVNSLNEVFKNKNLSADACKTIVENASVDNLELGCGLIAKIVIEKALNDVNHEESIKEAYHKRLGNFQDENFSKSPNWPGMPDLLKPKPTGLTREQFQVYNNFLNIMDNPKKNSPVPAQEVKSQDKTNLRFDEQVEIAEAVFASRNEAEDPEVQAAIANLIKIAVNNKSESLLLCASKIFKRIYTNELLINFYIQILQSMKAQHPALTKEVTDWVVRIEDHKKFYWHVTSELIKGDVVLLPEIDKNVAKSVDNDSQLAVTFAVSLVKELILKSNLFTLAQFPLTVTSLKSLRDRQPRNEELLKIFQEIPDNRPAPVFSAENDKQRELIVQKLEEWVGQGETCVNSEKAPNFVTSLENLGLMDKLDVLFGVMIEHAISKTKYVEEENYAVIDSLGKLFQVIMLMAQTGSKVKTLIVLMTAIKNLILKAAASYFNPRPYFRLFMLILTDITQPSPTFTDLPTVQEMLVPIASTLHLLNPMRVPGFCFAWLELVSHRFFMPKMLRTVNPSAERSQVPIQWGKMSVLVTDLLKFIYHNYNTFPLSESLKTFYNGTLKVIFVIMSDFPEFLCDYHYDFCNYIPEHCLQLRNLILSPYPKAMRPPSPFIPNLKVDLLPEMKIAPNILSNFKARLGSLKEDIDHYLASRDLSAIQSICIKLKSLELKANAVASNSLVLMVAELAVAGQVDQRFFNEFLLAILMGLDNEARKHLINAVANQLRYPNSHTQFFSCAMLHMFSECKKPFVEEQIARILTERTSAHRPHPWGLLITMIELVKNPRYEFLKKPFTHCTQDIENFYEKISKNFMGDQMDFLNN